MKSSSISKTFVQSIDVYILFLKPSLIVKSSTVCLQTFDTDSFRNRMVKKKKKKVHLFCIIYAVHYSETMLVCCFLDIINFLKLSTAKHFHVGVPVRWILPLLNRQNKCLNLFIDIPYLHIWFARMCTYRIRR